MERIAEAAHGWRLAASWGRARGAGNELLISAAHRLTRGKARDGLKELDFRQVTSRANKQTKKKIQTSAKWWQDYL